MPPTTAESVPSLRFTAVNDAPVRREREWVLYWMIAARRTRWNFGLQRAVEWARELGRPLLVLEPIRVGYRWASDRLHRFALDGMAENQARFEGAGVAYLPYVEAAPGAGKGLLEALAVRSCVVVTDEFPAFFLPRMVQAAGSRLDVRLEQVDSNGLLPLRAASQAYPTAFSFRAFLQKKLKPHLSEFPKADPLARLALPAPAKLPSEITRRWQPASAGLLSGEPAALAALPIDHGVVPSFLRGGALAGTRLLREFVDRRLPRYAAERSDPDADVASGLSPYLHWGHVSAHEVLAAIAAHEQGWSAEALPDKGGGSRAGWWSMSPDSEAFLDQLVTWRELGFNNAHHRSDADSYESVPGWARASLRLHEADPRPVLLPLSALEHARTPDPLWNAAQTQLLREGRIHNALRMLWGKRVLEWTRTGSEAAEVLLHLNDKYALDGRDPNSSSGILWTFGRYDRPWGPERPIFGMVRYMSSTNSAKKWRMKDYLARYAPEPHAPTSTQRSLPGL
jgi:deoxyribodipyrimidine photo-lyase